ncbi:hypothetical protein JMN11_14995 [Capnocytophaga genosp. AHN8471]|uniref:hypothetical protein n=1 Tax=Capnocytophaga genosp. AHN8471 TaxID=327574 RepID=UPI001932196E|nr:hypothetical protein [Capnocytophaga genosp. AHN8471]MBM0654943.1 hypothetical protein [Capnocytophaga genosp. AHN8471]
MGKKTFAAPATQHHSAFVTRKPCNWGLHRIPCSGDLDYGAAEFSPNEKYYPYGWKDYTP